MLLTVLFWGTNFSVTKVALREVPALPFSASRFLIASVVLGAMLARQGRLRLPDPRLRWSLIGLGLLGNTVYQLCFIQGLERTTATNSALIMSSVPALVTVLAGALQLEAIARRQWAAVAVATLGVVLVVTAGPGAELAGAATGDALMLGAAMCWAGYTVGVRRLAGGLSPLEVTTWTMLTGTPGLLLAGAPGSLRLDWLALSWTAWGGILYSALLSLVAAYVLWNRGVALLGAARAALYNTLTPLVATGVAMALLAERPTAWHALGASLILGGVLLARPRAPRGAPSPVAGEG